MPRLPYFPLNPYEYLLDEKVDSLNLEEQGALLKLWCLMWINKYKRGHLFYDKKTPMPRDQIAKILRISLKKFEKVLKILLSLGLVKEGKYGQLYSKRLSKYKTPYELEKKRSGRVQ